MRKLVLVVVILLSLVGLSSANASAVLGPAPKQVDAWAWCGVHPDDPSALAAAISMATVGGIDATFGPCYLGYPGYRSEDPGIEGVDDPYRYVSPQTYMRLVQINAQAGMKTVVYDNRVWSTSAAVRNEAVAFWTPVLSSIAAWDMGDEFQTRVATDVPPTLQWDTLVERWNRVRADVSQRTGVQPFVNQLEGSVDQALDDLPGSEQLLSFTNYTDFGDPNSLGVQTSRHLDPLVHTVMCGLNEFTHRPIPSVLLAPNPEKILDQGSRLVAAGCDRFLVFGGFVVYDKGPQRGTSGTAEYGSLSVVDQSGRPTTWATATFEAQGESTYAPAGPARLLDTRPGSPTFDGLATGLGMRAAGSTTELAVAGRAGLPVNATSAVLNVTATNEAAAGFLTVYPCNTARPNAAQVNFETSTDVATAVFAKLDPNGRTCIFNSQPTDIVVDVNGFLPLGSSFVPLAPARMIDTRGGYSTVDGAYNGVGVRGGGSVTEIQIGGRGGVPAGASEVAINVTATEVTVDGFVTIFPCATVPNASNVNYSAGKTATNAVMAPLRDDGRLCVFTSQTIDLVIDVNGFYPKAATFVSMQPTRFVDTRVAPPPPPIFGVDIDPAARDTNPPLILQIAGINGVPSTAKAAVINLTVTEPTQAGFATVYPCGSPRPTASNVNFKAGATVANLVVAQIGNSGAICIFTSVPTQVIVDVTNYHP